MPPESTGTVQSAAAQTITDMRHDVLQNQYVNDSGGALEPGMEVILKTDDTIDKRDAGTEFPFGIVVLGGADGEKVTIRSFFQSIIKGIATGGAITSGVFVKPNGVLDANDKPQYVAVAAGDYAAAHVLVGAAEDAEITIGILESPVNID